MAWHRSPTMAASARKVAITGGGREILALAEAAITLKAGTGTGHPELFAFRTWGEVQDYAENDPGGSDLQVFIEAGAGTGKTTTLKMLGADKPGRKGIYIAYNKAIAEDAKRSFPAGERGTLAEPDEPLPCTAPVATPRRGPRDPRRHGHYIRAQAGRTKILGSSPLLISENQAHDRHHVDHADHRRSDCIRRPRRGLDQGPL